MTRDLCSQCGQELPEVLGRITPRELDVLTCWWMTDNLRLAAQMAGVGEQRAKNMMRAARMRNRVQSNQALLAAHYPAVREKALERMHHNVDRSAAA